MKKSYYVKGIHCMSCEMLIKRKIKSIKNVTDVTFFGKKVQIESKVRIPFDDLKSALEGTDYSLSSRFEFPWKDILWGVGIVLIVYWLLHLISLDRYIQVDVITVPTAFLMGILASFSSCMATAGGLLLGISSQVQTEKIKSFTLMFHNGRLVGYMVGGAILGSIGSVVSFSSQITGTISFIVSLLMIAMGLQLLGIVPPWSVFASVTEKLRKMNVHSPLSAFLIGAGTFLLPCGFTQSLQLYALSTGDPFIGMILLLSFALGTLPALVLVGSFTHLVSGAWRIRLTNVAAVIVAFIGFSMLLPSLTLIGVPTFDVADSSINMSYVPVEDGYQIVNMEVNRLDYYPHIFKLQKDIPVKWIIDGTNAVGCARILTSPSLNIVERLNSGQNIVEFTPSKEGEYPFHCSMAMTTPGAKFIVV